MKKTTKSKEFKNKLKSYGALATGVLAVGNVANAQIIYTDVDPDEVITGDSTSYLLDLNNDGVKDYRMVTLDVTGSSSGVVYSAKGAGVYPLGQNEILTDGSSYVQVLNNGDAIGANQNVWSATSSAFALNVKFKTQYMGQTVTYTYGLWNGVTDKFMGVKFDINGSWHYGWVRMDVNANADSIVIKGFAYNAQPNSPLTAGEDGVGFAELPVNLNNINVSSYGQSVIIEAESILAKETEAVIIDAMGKEIYRGQIQDGRNEIALNVSAGIYYVNIRMGDAIINEKVYIQ
jgi:hypothetical protein